MNEDVKKTNGDFEVVDTKNEEMIAVLVVKPMGKEFQVEFSVGVQHFDIGPLFPTMEEARWMQKQFQKAQQNFIAILTGIAVVEKNQIEGASNDGNS